RQITRIDWAASFGGSSDRCRSTQVAQATRVQLPEAPLLPEARHGHVHDLAFTQRAEPDVALRSIGVALDGPRAAPLVEAGKTIRCRRRPDEVWNPSARSGERGYAPLLEKRPDAIADGLLAIVQGPSPPASNREDPRLEQMESAARAEPHVDPKDEADGADEQLPADQRLGTRDLEEVPHVVSPQP